MSYEEFFRLKEQPFSNTPDNKFYFKSQQHDQAMLRLVHAAATMKGLAILVGDIGTGKTTLARKMLDNLDEKEFESVLLVVVHSAVTPQWLLKKIALQLGVKDITDSKVELLSALYRKLMEINETGRKVVVLVDEAQMLQSRELMEEFRGLLNLEMPGRKMITFIFFALPIIDQYLSLDEPLKQRVAVKFRLNSMKEDATEAYIRHRLKVAECDRDLFSPEAIDRIHAYSRGIPRLINIICDNALFEAFLLKKEFIEKGIIESVADDLGLEKPDVIPRRSRGKGSSGEGQPDSNDTLGKEEMEALNFLQEVDE